MDIMDFVWLGFDVAEIAAWALVIWFIFKKWKE